MNWQEITKRGGIASDLMFGELTEMEGDKAQNRIIPSVMTRVGLNIGAIVHDLTKTLVADPGKRPESLMNTVAANFDARTDYNKSRAEIMKRNRENRPRLIQR